MHRPLRRLRPRGCRPLLAALALFGFMGVTAAAVPEYELKAVLLYKVAKFVRWPEGTFAPGSSGVHVCIVGRDDFGASIDALSGQRLQGQVVSVERLQGVPKNAVKCQIVFVSRSESANLAGLLATLATSQTLTVSDLEGFASAGGMIELATTDNKIQFQINAAASRRAGLEIGAQLLQLATLVTEPHAGARP